MEVGKLEVEVRSDVGKGIARKLRQSGRIPGVCYGGGEPPLPVALDPKALRAALDPEKRQNTLITMTVKGQGGDRQLTVMLKDYQTDLFGKEILHADFVRVDLTKEIRVTVPLVLTGKAEGVKVGGILHQVFRTVDVACLPDRVPTRIEVDVTPLNIGDALKASDLPVSEGVRVLLDPRQSVAVVVAPKEEKAAAAEGEAAAEAAPPAEGKAAEGKAAEGKAAEGKAEDKKAAAKAAARAQAKSDKAGAAE